MCFVFSRFGQFLQKVTETVDRWSVFFTALMVGALSVAQPSVSKQCSGTDHLCALLTNDFSFLYSTQVL